MMAAKVESRILAGLAAVVVALCLLASWVLLWGAMEMVTWGLAPYDTAPEQNRPPAGSWQREVSDFFDGPPGSWVPSILVTGAAVGLALWGLGSRGRGLWDLVNLAVRQSLANVAAAAILVAVIFVCGVLPLELAPYPGFGWTVKFLVPHGLVLLLWLGWSIRQVGRAPGAGERGPSAG